jgi:hypothetical protein
VSLLTLILGFSPFSRLRSATFLTDPLSYLINHQLSQAGLQQYQLKVYSVDCPESLMILSHVCACLCVP